MEKVINPLISVCVVTYNSADTVLETLESIKAQSYANIELIISDDASKDHTVAVCQEWVNKNRDRFIATEVITVQKNTGISANCNRAFTRARGEWIKIIAGDDRLRQDCITSNWTYISEHEDIDILFSRIKPFGDLGKIARYERMFIYGYFQMSHKAFLYRLLTGNFLPAPTSFIRKESYLALGGFDESIPFIEDWPFWIKTFMNGMRLSFMNKCTVDYRMADTSISMNSQKSYAFLDSMERAKCLASGYMRKKSLLLWLYMKTVYEGENGFLRALSYFARLFNPILYYLKYNEYRALILTDKIIASDE